MPQVVCEVSDCDTLAEIAPVVGFEAYLDHGAFLTEESKAYRKALQKIRFSDRNVAEWFVRYCLHGPAVWSTFCSLLFMVHD